MSIVKQKLPSVNQYWMRWSTDKSVGLSSNFQCVCVHIFLYIFSLPFKSGERSEGFFFSLSSVQKMVCTVCVENKVVLAPKKYFFTWNLIPLFHQEETVPKQVGVLLCHIFAGICMHLPLRILCDSLTGGAPDKS